MLNAISALAPVASQAVQGLQGIAAAGGGALSQATTAQAGAPDFASVFANAAQGLADKLGQGEAAAIEAVQGKAAVQDVVQAVMSAEQSLQFAMAVRDKAVAAYQQFANMAI
ncbi:MAG: flagellar hook-basal body protein FliE [Chelatococcus sp.]|nr:MAG: flagellar hook-basal body protein FliE [Chelatococcus sp.]